MHYVEGVDVTPVGAWRSGRKRKSNIIYKHRRTFGASEHDQEQNPLSKSTNLSKVGRGGADKFVMI